MIEAISWVGVLVAAVAVAWWRGRSSGRDEAYKTQKEQQQKAKERIDAVSVDGLTDDDIASRLRDHAKR